MLLSITLPAHLNEKLTELLLAVAMAKDASQQKVPLALALQPLSTSPSNSGSRDYKK